MNSPQATTPAPIAFPSTRKVTLELEIKVSNQDELNYIQDPSDGSINLGFIADVFDVFTEQLILAEVQKINGRTQAELRKIFEQDITAI